MSLSDTETRLVADHVVEANGGCPSGTVPVWQRRIRLRWVCATVALVSCCASGAGAGAAHAAPLSEGEFAGLAARCAPTVAVQTLRAVALTESGLDPWALHDNTTGISESQPSFEAALAEALSWLDRGDSVDIGLMQINSTNLVALGMTARTALDACASLAGGAAVLQAAYGEGGGATPADQQVALLLALSRYNTGSPFRGILNGYVRRVMASVEGAPASAMVVTSGTPSPASDAFANPHAPPAWNVGAVGSYAQTHGAPWLVALAPPSSSKANAVGPPASALVPSIVVAANAPLPAGARIGAPTQTKTRNPS
jgi:type IV secretion system protein VirB1